MMSLFVLLLSLMALEVILLALLVSKDARKRKSRNDIRKRMNILRDLKAELEPVKPLLSSVFEPNFGQSGVKQ